MVVEEYLRTSFPGVDQEYRDGELQERRVPGFEHSRTQANLTIFFGNRRGQGCHVFPELRLRLRKDRVCVPDITVYWPECQDRNDVPPLIVVEILSPDDRMSSVREKLREYFEWGVRHVWLIDPEARATYEFRNDGLHEVPGYDVREAGLTLGHDTIFG
jgi:Uma2 family endonuclease